MALVPSVLAKENVRPVGSTLPTEYWKGESCQLEEWYGVASRCTQYETTRLKMNTGTPYLTGISSAQACSNEHLSSMLC